MMTPQTHSAPPSAELRHFAEPESGVGARLRRQTPVAGHHPRSRKSGVIILVLVLMIAGCQETPSGYPGYVEGEYLYLAAPAAGRLLERSVERGMSVSAGDSLFLIDPTSQKAALRETEHRYEAARASYADLTSGKRTEEIEVIRTQLAQATASARLARTQAVRARGLFERGSIPQSELDLAEAELDRADARVLELEASILTAELPARTDAQRAARAQFLAAGAAMDRARWVVDEMQSAAPAAGLIQDVFYDEGEWVPAGSPVVSLLPPERRKILFFVPETLVATLEPGQDVAITCDACSGPVRARITYIADEAEYTPPVIYSLEQRADLVFRVEARPSPEDATRMPPGLPVSVEIPIAEASDE